MLTLGSLFDGSGGFPLAGEMNGFEPLWASEIDPTPIRVTRSHFPEMEHVGDVTTIDGATLQPVDVITFGSPCTDLSIAGKKEGLDGEHSSLFFHAIRIVKEMRKATYGNYPRWIVWENVPNALRSNQGQDFRRVLEEILSITEEEPAPIREGNKWPTAGYIRTGTASVCWRVLDAQYFGVPQRRKRIFLIADLDGAGAISLFVDQEGVRGDSQESKQRESIPIPAASSRKPDYPHWGWFDINPSDSRYTLKTSGVFQTLTAHMGTGGNNTPLVLVPTKDQLPYVRKVTPWECALLQGFPYLYCDFVSPIHPSEEELDFYKGVWDHWADVRGKKRLSRNRVRTWLTAPMTDAAQYRLWGNGVALPVVGYVLQKIAGVHSGKLDDVLKEL